MKSPPVFLAVIVPMNVNAIGCYCASAVDVIQWVVGADCVATSWPSGHITSIF